MPVYAAQYGNNTITIDDDDNEIFYSVEKLTCNNDDIILLSDTENDFFICHVIPEIVNPAGDTLGHFHYQIPKSKKKRSIVETTG